MPSGMPSTQQGPRVGRDDFPFFDADARDESGHLIRELHGVTLQAIVEALVKAYGWTELAERIRINCFAVNPSVKSSLTFLRRTPWARAKVEELYVLLRLAEVAGAPRP